MNHDWYHHDFFAAWHYTVVLPVHFYTPEIPGDFDICRRGTPKSPLAIVRDKLLSILPGYAFDGATGGPDFKCIMRAVALHDLLCQCCEVPDWPVRRLAADRMFYREARKDAPWLAPIYFAAVRIGGGLHRLCNPPAPAEGIVIHRLTA